MHSFRGVGERTMTTKPMSTMAAHRPRKPRGLLRLAFRLPLLIYRGHLGWILGHRFLLLKHRGRKTGSEYETMLEVLDYDPATRESIVFSGMGVHADWYRNIQAHPAGMVRTGRQSYMPEHRVLPRVETAAVMARFAREHPWEARLFVPVLRWLGWSVREAPDGLRLPSDLVLVAFRPAEASR